MHKWYHSYKFWSHTTYWLCMYLFSISSHWAFEVDKIELVEKTSIKTGLLILLSYAVIYILIPHFLKKNRKPQFFIISILWVYIVYVTYTALRFYFYDIKFPDVYVSDDFWKRVTDLSVFFYEIDWFLFPTVLLVAIQYYTDQQEVIKLREQKNLTELNLLKNQLNPHFLFNTLNNLYALAIKKSDQTPEVIGKLSEILDYILYQCEDQFVAVSKEINLLNNYIELEKVRYGKRLDISFDYKIAKGVRIAPLIMLTFVENAFKHGVKEEVTKAVINIDLTANKKEIIFEIKNTLPPERIKKSLKANSIGLRNVRKQLEILYPNSNSINLVENENSYFVTLKLAPNEL